METEKPLNDGEDEISDGQNTQEELFRYSVSPHQLNSLPRSSLNLPPALCSGFWSLNTHNQQLITPSDSLLYSFFPLCVGPMCTPICQNDFKRLLFSVTFYLILLQVILYIYLLLVSQSPASDLNIDPDLLVSFGAVSTSGIRNLELWRLVVVMFLHGNAIHLLINIFLEFIFLLGREGLWGKIKTLVIYFLSSLSGSFFTLCLNNDVNTVGASSALFGVFGAFIANYIVIFDKLPWRHRIGTVSMIVVFIILLLFSGNQQQIDNYGHIGGFATGLGLGLIMFAKLAMQNTLKYGSYIVGVILIISFMVIPVFYFFMNKNS